MEDGGLRYFYTEHDFLDDLLSACRVFLQETGIIKNVYNYEITSGTGTYTLGEDVSKIDEVFVDKRHLQKSSGFFMDNYEREWGTESDFPQKWRTDQIDDGTVEISPTPNFNGATLPDQTGNLKVIASQVPTQTSLSMSDNIPLMPDSMATYLKFAVLEVIFSMDGEGKDMARADYCRARVDECIGLFKAVMEEEALMPTTGKKRRRR